MAILRYAGVAIVAALLGYLILVEGLAASAMSQGNIALALRLRPSSSEPLARAAESALRRNDLPAAEAFARKALAQMPRNVRALRVLGIATTLRGRPRLGSELLLRSGALSWRDEVTQLWLIRAAIAQSNFATAAQRIDAMLRGGQLNAQMMNMMHQLANIPQARDAVVRRLAEGPRWRRSFFVNMEYLPRGSEASHALLLEDVRGLEGPLQREEVAYFLSHMMTTGDHSLARRVWLSTLSAEQRGLVSNVFDGDFREDAGAQSAQPRYPFEWSFERGPEVVSIGNPPMLIGETALAVRAGDARQVLASQALVLRPGRYGLSYDVMSEGQQRQAFEWRVVCEGNGAPLALEQRAERVVGTWRSVRQQFAVPANCRAQRLQAVALAWPGGGTAEAWFDHVRIE